MTRITEADLQDPVDRKAIIDLNVEFAKVTDARLAEDHSEGLDALLASHPTVFAFLARADDGTPVGYALCQFTITSFAAGTAANVHDVFVLKEARGAGIGRALMEHFEAKARSHGCRKISLEVDGDNTRAGALYRDLGFGDGRPGSAGDHTWFWYKMLT